jgi:hypothetical protein
MERNEQAVRPHLAVSILALCSMAGMVPATLSAQEISDDWQFGAAIYGWFPDIGGNTALPPRGDGSFAIDIGTILDHLEMTGQGSFAIQKGHWGAFTDLIYLDVGASKSATRQLEVDGNPLPAGVTADLDFGLKTTIWMLGGSYRISASPEGSFDLLAGTRLASFEQTLDWEFTGNLGPIAPPPRTGSRDASVDQWDAIIGLKGRRLFGTNHTWVLPYYLDIGAGDSDLTWQAMLGLGYAFQWGGIELVWRYLEYDLASGGAIEDMNFNGPALGVTFRW